MRKSATSSSRREGVFGPLGFGRRGGHGRLKPLERRPPRFEPLEDRNLLSVCVWDGGSTADSKWTTPENWVGDVAPQAGDDLQFAGTQRTTTQNDFTAGTSFHSIEFAASSFSLTGNSITLTGGIMVDNGVVDSVVGLNAALSGSITVNIVSGDSSFITGVLSGSTGSLTKTGNGWINLWGDNTYGGGTTISAGVVSVGNGGTTGSLEPGTNVSDNSWLRFRRSDNITVDNSISGSGGLAQDGSGVLTLTGDNTYLNGTINYGTISVDCIADSGVSRLGYGGLSMDGATLRYTGSAASSTGSHLALDHQAVVFEITQASGALTWNGGGGGTVNCNITKTGAGTFTMGHFIGGGASVTVNGGTLALTAADTYNGGTTIAAGTLQLGDGTTDGSVTGDITDDAVLVFDNAANATYGGVISGEGGLTKLGTGTLTLTGANTYSGDTVISEGTLEAGSEGAIPSGAGRGNVQVDDTLDLAGYDVTLNGLSGSGTVTTSSSETSTLTVGANDQTSTFDGLIDDGSGVVALVKTGTGTLALSWWNGYSGGTTIGDGTLSFAEGGLGSGDVVFDGGTLQWAADNQEDVSGQFAAVGSGEVAMLDTGGNDVTLATAISGDGGLEKLGDGTLTLTGANDYGGGTAVSGGILEAATPDALPGYNTSGRLTVAAGATLAVATAGWDSDAIDDLLANPSFHSGTLGIDVATGDTFTYASDITGPIGLTKLGGGTLTVSGTNDYAGDTTIAAGVLIVSDGDSLPHGLGYGIVAIDADATLDLNGQSITLNGLSGSGTVTTSGTGRSDLTLGAGDSSSTFDGVVEDGSGTVGLVKTGSGTLELKGANTYTGGTTLQEGVVSFGALDSVFAQSDEITFNTKLQDAFRLAEPGSYSGTFGISSLGLNGTLSVGSDGVIYWTPDGDADAGTYTLAATYNYSGGSQVKALSLTINTADLPPVFPYTDYAFSPSPPMPSADWHNDEIVISRQIAGGQYSVDWTYPAWGEGTVTYQLIPGSLGLPSGYTFDTSTGEFTCTVSNADKFMAYDFYVGEFTCTVSNADKFMAYDFYVKATDGSGQFDLEHVVIPVTGNSQGDPYLTPWAPDADLGYSSWNQSQGYEEISLYPTEYPEPIGYKELVIDQAPAHGTLSDGAYWTDVKYTPAEGFQGVDSFSYHWVYDAYANGQVIYRYSTNVGRIQIQVGPWVDLTPTDPYTTDTALVGVGGSTTVTLTLQNPRADGYTSGGNWQACPSTGYWQLTFMTSQIRVYEADGTEVLPDSTFLNTVAGEDQITLTVVGVSAGQAYLSARWNVWDCADTYYPGLVPGWYFYNTHQVTVDVVAVDLSIDSDNNDGYGAPDHSAKRSICRTTRTALARSLSPTGATRGFLAFSIAGMGTTLGWTI